MKRRANVAITAGWIAAFLVALALLTCLMCASIAGAADVAAERIVVPSASYLYRYKLQREVAARFGDQSSVARVAAQVHQESRWRADARSRYAEGLAQFVPATGQWLSQDVCPEIGPHDPWSADWSVRAIVCYDAWLYRRIAGAASDCDRWAFALSGYNGGPTWVVRDRNLASSSGLESARWFDHVALVSARADWALTENRAYVARILRVLEPAYIDAGWPGTAVCR